MDNVTYRLYDVVMRFVIAFMELITNSLSNISKKFNEWQPIKKRKYQHKSLNNIWEEGDDEEEESNSIFTDEEVNKMLKREAVNLA